MRPSDWIDGREALDDGIFGIRDHVGGIFGFVAPSGAVLHRVDLGRPILSGFRAPGRHLEGTFWNPPLDYLHRRTRLRSHGGGASRVRRERSGYMREGRGEAVGRRGGLAMFRPEGWQGNASDWSGYFAVRSGAFETFSAGALRVRPVDSPETEYWDGFSFVQADVVRQPREASKVVLSRSFVCAVLPVVQGKQPEHDD